MVLTSLVATGRIEPGQFSITFSPSALAEALDLALEDLTSEALQIQGAFTLRRPGAEARLVMGENVGSIDRTLLKTLARG